MSGLIDRIFPRRNDSPEPNTGDTPPEADSSAPAEMRPSDNGPVADAPFETPDGALQPETTEEPAPLIDAPLESDGDEEPVAAADDQDVEADSDAESTGDADETADLADVSSGDPTSEEDRDADVAAVSSEPSGEDDAEDGFAAAGDTPPSGFEPVAPEADAVDAGDTPPSGFEPVGPAPDDTAVLPSVGAEETQALPAVGAGAVAAEAAVDSTQSIPAVEAPEEGKKRRFGRRKKKDDPLAPAPLPLEPVAPDLAAPAPQPQPQPVLVASPAAVDMPDSPGISVRAKLRRRLRFLRKERELLLRDLGGFVFDSRRFARSREDLITLKIQKLGEVDFEVRTLENALKDRRPLHEMREPGIGGSCSNCGAFFPSSARYCSDCGASVSHRRDFGADATTMATPAVPAPAQPAAGAAEQPTQPPAQPVQPATPPAAQQPIRQPAGGSLWSGATPPAAPAPAPSGANGASEGTERVSLPGGISRPDDSTGEPPPMSSGDPLNPPPHKR